VGAGAWALFAILFAWQHPHFFAIAWIFRDDYRAAGFKMLPAIERSGVTTVRLTIVSSLILLAGVTRADPDWDGRMGVFLRNAVAWAVNAGCCPEFCPQPRTSALPEDY
jgi:heme O synthase-like polyprenyltransferase